MIHVHVNFYLCVYVFLKRFLHCLYGSFNTQQPTDVPHLYGQGWQDQIDSSMPLQRLNVSVRLSTIATVSIDTSKSKYVHPQCLALWRQSLAESGHKDESYRCTLCLRRFQICHSSWWAALVSNPGNLVFKGTMDIVMCWYCWISDTLHDVSVYPGISTGSCRSAWFYHLSTRKLIDWLIL